MSTIRGIVKSGMRGLPIYRQNRLDSWKEIAAYLRREVRTVQRWELFEELPVRRLFHRKASSVYAFAGELDLWMATRIQGQGVRPGIQAECSDVVACRALSLATHSKQGLM